MNFVYLVSVIISLCFFNGYATLMEDNSEDNDRCRGKVYFSSAGSRRIKGLNHDVEKTKIPSRFDAREEWPKCKSLFLVNDQGHCGGCWAFAASSVMSDRICIHSEQKVQNYISTQDLLECCEKCVAEGDEFVGGCEGGSVTGAFEFWASKGLVIGSNHRLKGCKPINKEIIKGIPQKTCREECTNKNYTKSYQKSKRFGMNLFKQRDPLKNGLEQIQIELMKNGPIVAAYRNYRYIGHYGKNAVISYEPEKLRDFEKNKTEGSHAIKIIGWDVTEEGTPVWIIANSWGKDWCDSGFCRMKRGVNELLIEEFSMMGALPRYHSDTNKRGIVNKKKFDAASLGSGLFVCSLSLNVILTLGLYFLE